MRNEMNRCEEIPSITDCTLQLSRELYVGFNIRVQITTESH